MTFSFLILVFLYSLVYGQESKTDCELIIRDVSSELKYKNALKYEIVKLTEKDYEALKKHDQSAKIFSIDTTRLDLENCLLRDSIYYTNSITGEKEKLFRDNQLTLAGNELNYETKGEYCNHILAYVWAYESWGYISVGIKSARSFYTSGKPITLDCETIFSYSNYYGEEEISIINVKTEKEQTIVIDGWKTENYIITPSEFALKLKSMNCEGTFEYIKINCP